MAHVTGIELIDQNEINES